MGKPMAGIGRVGRAGTSRVGKKRPKLIREKDRRIEEEKRERAWVKLRESAVHKVLQGQFSVERGRCEELAGVLNAIYRQGRADLLSETLAGM